MVENPLILDEVVTIGTSGKRSRFHIGMRNVKTGLAVLVCLSIYHITGRDGRFLACTSAIICLQDSVEKSVISGLSRLTGTGFGALLGMVLLYINMFLHPVDITIVAAVVGTMLMILFCNLIRRPDAIVIGCVVLLLIVLQETSDNPFFYSINRLIDTAIGIFVAVVVNRFVRNPAHRIPKEDPQPTDTPPDEIHDDHPTNSNQEGTV